MTAFTSKLDRPIFLMSMPRSGSTLLFDTLSRAADLFTTGRESHARIEQVADFHPRKRGWTSNRLDASDATPEVAVALADSFYPALRDRDGSAATGAVRMLEKTPKNALRVPLFNAIWPESIFLFLYRDRRETLASMIEAWESGRFRTYPMLPEWTGLPWSLLLVPGWRDLIDRPLPIIVASQWATAMNILVDDLAKLPIERLRAADYATFIAKPDQTIKALTASLDLDFAESLGMHLPLSQHTVSAPSTNKWRRFEHLIEPVLPIVAQADDKARALIARISQA